MVGTQWARSLTGRVADAGPVSGVLVTSHTLLAGGLEFWDTGRAPHYDLSTTTSTSLHQSDPVARDLPATVA